MNMGHRHLSDDEIIWSCVDRSDLAARAWEGCEVCAAKRSALSTLLEEVVETATVDVEASFTPDRLSRQRARILHRLGQDGRHGRVISFPVHANEPGGLRAHLASRWVAGAAAAGLAVGLFGGYLARDTPPAADAAAVGRLAISEAAPIPAPAVFELSTTVSDDEFLGQIEMVADGPGGTSLRSLHDLTPAAWDVR